MDALLMCGGRGTRLDAAVEKPLFEVGDRPMVDRVRDALADSRVETVHAVVSPNAPATRTHLAAAGVRTVETPGEGYVADLQRALRTVDAPVLTVAADLPLLAGDVVDAVVDAHSATGGAETDSLTVCVPAALKRALGVTVDTAFERDGRTLAPAGVNVVGAEAVGGDDANLDGLEPVYVTYDARFAVNVNRLADARLAEDLL